MKHANKYDGIEVWCDPDVFPDPQDIVDYGRDGHLPPEALAEVTCPACLRAIAAYGRAAMRRLVDIQFPAVLTAVQSKNALASLMDDEDNE